MVSPGSKVFALGLARVFGLRSFTMDIAPRWTATRQLLGLSYYKARQLQAPCSTFEDVPEPRPTNLAPGSGYYLILPLMAYPPG